MLFSRAWRYEPLSLFEEDTDGRRFQQYAPETPLRQGGYSRIFWRAALGSTALLLLLNLFKTNIEVSLSKYRVEAKQQPLNNESVSDTDWSQYAYCQYVTTPEYFCNSLMIFQSLGRVGSEASRVMMYPQNWTVDETTAEGRLLVQARDELEVALQPIQVQHFDGEETWADSFTKLLAFNQTKHKRVLSLDSDATVLQSMDELFLLPDAPVAMPRAYWMKDKPNFLSSQLVLVEPSEFEMQRVNQAFENLTDDEYDMEIVNNLYGESCIVIPHRGYGLLTGEFRAEEHHLYLGSQEELWDPDLVLAEAKFVHFSDWPMPKPWISATQEQKDTSAPKCRVHDDGTEDCRDRYRWFSLYHDFRARREAVCGTGFVQR